MNSAVRVNHWTKSANSSDLWTFAIDSVPILFSWRSSGCAVVNASERSKNWRPRSQSCLNVEFGEAVRSREATLDLDRLRARADAQGAVTKI